MKRILMLLIVLSANIYGLDYENQFVNNQDGTIEFTSVSFVTYGEGGYGKIQSNWHPL